MEAFSKDGIASKRGRTASFLIVMSSLAVCHTVALGTVCILIWARHGIQHAALVDRETLIALTGYLIFMFTTHTVGVIASVWRSILGVFVFAVILVISFAVDLTTGSIATLRYQTLWSDGPNNETMRGSWEKLSLPQRDAFQLELNCCGFSSPADDLFETVTCHPEAELPGCHLPWKNFLSYEVVGVATTFYATAIMHAMLLILAAAIFKRRIREASIRGSGPAGRLENNMERPTAYHAERQHTGRPLPSRSPLVARRPSSEVFIRTMNMAAFRQASVVGISPVAWPSRDVHNRASITFGVATGGAVPAPNTDRGANVNTRHSHPSILASALSMDDSPSDSLPDEPPCCHCADGLSRGVRCQSAVINDRCPSFAKNLNTELALPRPLWMSEEARIARRYTFNSPMEFVGRTPSNCVSLTSATSISSYHTASEDIESETRGRKERLALSNVLEWDEDVESFICGRTTGEARIHNWMKIS